MRVYNKLKITENEDVNFAFLLLWKYESKYPDNETSKKI